MAVYITREQVKDEYVSYEEFNTLMTNIDNVEKVLENKQTGETETETNSSPQWGDLAVISANEDGSFFVRWVCKDPRGRDLNFSMSINNSPDFHVAVWDNDKYFTCYVPAGYTEQGDNYCYLVASNGFFQTPFNNTGFIVNIPYPHIPTAPTISQNIGDVETVLGMPTTISYIASDDGTIVKHYFGNDGSEVDITSIVQKQGTSFSYLTTFMEVKTINNCYIRIVDNEGLEAKSNTFKITVNN
jgi:hypothetical protein